MRIIHLVPPAEYYSPISGGAVATVVMEHARELGLRGHEVTVLTPNSPDKNYDVGQVVRLDTRVRSDLGLIRRVLSLLRRRMNGWEMPYYDYYLRAVQRYFAKIGDNPGVIVFHNDFVTPKMAKAVLPKTSMVVMLHNQCHTRSIKIAELDNYVDQILSPTEYIRKWTAERYGIPLRKIGVVPHGVNAKEFYPSKSSVDRALPTRVLYVGRLEIGKGPDIVVKAVGSLVGEGIPVRLTVVGAPWWYERESDRADRYVADLTVAMHRIKANHLGHMRRADVPSIMREHDIMVIPSRFPEGFGLVALEGMASGCAVVASDRGGLVEACGGAALLINPEDQDAVTASIKSLVVNPGLLDKYKVEGLRHAGKATWGLAVETFLDQIKGKIAP